MSLISAFEVMNNTNFLNRFHIAEVMNNTDPKNLNRVRIKIPNVLESSDPALLPWATVLKPNIFGSQTAFGIQCKIEVGSKVLISFPFGDVYNPVVHGVLELVDGYSAGETSAKYSIKDPLGNIFLVKPDGSLEYTNIKDITLDGSGGKIKLSNSKVAIGTSAVELLSKIIDTQAQLIQLITDMTSETHIGNLGYLTSTPVNAAAYMSVKSQIQTLKSDIESIKGNI